MIMVIEKLDRELERLVIHPNHAETYNAIGVLLYQIGDLKNAEIYMNRAYKLNFANDDILYNYGLVLYENVKYKDSLEICRQYQCIQSEDEFARNKIQEISYILENDELGMNIRNEVDVHEGQ